MINRNNMIRSVLVGNIFIVAFSAIAAMNGFRLVGPATAVSSSQERYLKIFPTQLVDCAVPFWARVKNPKYPGEYFIFPDGADSVAISKEEFKEINNLLSQNVYNSYYDDFVLDNIFGYRYTFIDSAVWRHEYYVSYARADTIFVISGWFGRFISFYKAVPGDFRYDIDDLQSEIEKISPSYVKTKAEQFKWIDEDINYFLEHLDKRNMMRIRNYQIDARFSYGISDDKLTKYNLIEITKFIDPEAMP